MRSHLEIVAKKLKTVRADVVPDVMTFLQAPGEIVIIQCLFSVPVKVMEYPESFGSVQLAAPASEFSKMRYQLSAYPVEICLCISMVRLRPVSLRT